MGVIDISNVSFAYDKQLILEDINLTVEKDDFLAIIGPNGGGKSTLLKLILDIHKPKKGTIRILGGEPRRTYHISVMYRKIPMSTPTFPSK